VETLAVNLVEGFKVEAMVLQRCPVGLVVEERVAEGGVIISHSIHFPTPFQHPYL
jgi:hypothetical protein